MLEHKIKVHVKDIMGIILIYIVRRNGFASYAVRTHVYLQRWFYPFYTTFGCYKPWCAVIQQNVGKDIYIREYEQN